ncbi:KleE stable inheritance protein [Methylobacter psychrophilus]|uniref:KleE stable inheritance protein n=1 Tax=Methylobacter psychrophilus TaxID=96941 RepID=UPI0021D49E3E|nr:KleE stable inheritance protein [Methylobacter psychrophilus]
MKSAKLYQFPLHIRTASIPIDPAEDSFITKNGSNSSIKANKIACWKRIQVSIIGLVWLFLGLFWPLLNWLAAMDVVFQLLRALYYANTPAIQATLQALIHGVLYIFLSLFVYLYRPKAF